MVAGNTIFGTVHGQGRRVADGGGQETPGYMYNIRDMANKKRWKTTVFGTEDAIIQLAIQGGSPELKEFLPEPVPIKFKLLHGEAYWAQGKSSSPPIRISRPSPT